MSQAFFRSHADTATRTVPTADRLAFSVDEADPGAFDRYEAFYALGSDVAPLGERFHAELSCRRLDRMVLHDRRLRGVSHGRAPARVRAAGLEHFTVTLCLSGTMHGAGGQGFRRIKPGEVWLADMAQPARTRIEDARLLTLAIGREVVEAAVRHPADLHATVLPAAQVAPLAGFLHQLADPPAAPAANETPAATQEVIRLVGAMLGAPSSADTTRLERLVRARRLIDAHLDRADLDAELIAADLGISRSGVYRLFAPLGGVAGFIQARRIARLRLLLSERSIDTSLAELAERVGLASESHASRRFLDRYGVRPGAFRTGTRRLSDFGVGMVRMADWLADLQ